MEERLKFVARLLDGEKMAVMCREFGISRKTGYKIFNRYKELGLDGLNDQSRRPLRYANQLPFQVERRILALKAWVPTILVRVYDMDLADAGRQYGVLALFAGSAGVLTGPVLERALRRLGDTSAPLRVAMIGAMSATVCLLVLPTTASSTTALAAIAGASFSVTLPLALVTTVMQEVTPNEMRGVVNGLYVVTANVLGLALGPTLVAVTTDYIYQDVNAVARSLATVAAFVGPIAALVLWSGTRAYRTRAEGR